MSCGVNKLSRYEILRRILLGLAANSTTIVGAPTTGTFVAGDLWIDALGAIFLCSVGGTPGTWVQNIPGAVVGSGQYPVDPPVSYLVVDSFHGYSQFYWSGSAWVPVFLTP